jgi:hypothetical protein
VLQNLFVRLSLAVLLDVVIIARVRGDGITGLQVREVTLDITAGAAAAGSGKANVGGHVWCCVGKRAGGGKATGRTRAV